MQCQLYNPVGSNQGLQVLHGCESFFLRPFASSLAQPGPLLPAAAGRGLGGKAKAERGGAFPLLVTSNNKYFRYRPPKADPLPLEINIYTLPLFHEEYVTAPSKKQ